jgi:hypothetical protein
MMYYQCCRHCTSDLPDHVHLTRCHRCWPAWDNGQHEPEGPER